MFDLKKPKTDGRAPQATGSFSISFLLVLNQVGSLCGNWLYIFFFFLYSSTFLELLEYVVKVGQKHLQSSCDMSLLTAQLQNGYYRFLDINNYYSYNFLRDFFLLLFYISGFKQQYESPHVAYVWLKNKCEVQLSLIRSV